MQIYGNRAILFMERSKTIDHSLFLPNALSSSILSNIRSIISLILLLNLQETEVSAVAK